MVATASEAIRTLHIVKETSIAADVETVFEATLLVVGPEATSPDGTPFPFQLEAWPGGRWYRDLGDNAGHFWGHVQVIKPPTLLELNGPMCMSYPAISHIQYQLTEQGASTRLRITHRAIGLLADELMSGVHVAWDHGLKHVTEIALRLKQR